MPLAISSGYCSYCRRRVRCQKKVPAHLVHAIMTVLTAGIWLLVWICLCFANLPTPYRCDKCGSIVKGSRYG